MKKAFTLIELLAVIVILAIIALIATPIVLGIIDDTRKSANERTVEAIIKEVELAYSTAYMQNGGNTPTIDQVKQGFDMDQVTWTGDAPIVTNNTAVSCTSAGGTNLVITCTVNDKTFTTNTSMDLQA